MPELPMENNNKLAMTSLEPSPRLGFIGILRKASTIPLRNGRLTVSLILLMLLPFLLLSFGFHLAFDAVWTDLQSKISLLPKHRDSPEAEKILKEICEDMRKLLGAKLIFALAFSLISLFSLTTTVSSSAMLYVEKHFTLKDLFRRVKMTWTGPLITGFFIALISIAYFLVTLLLIGVVAILARDGVFSTVLVALIVLLAIIFYIRLANLWMLGVVISVIEIDCKGMQAVAKAERLISGRKLQGILFILLISLMGIIGAAVVLFTGRSTEHRGVVWLFVWMGMTCLICLVKLFSFVIYTVFYYECKQSHEENVEVAYPKGYVVLTASEF